MVMVILHTLYPVFQRTLASQRTFAVKNRIIAGYSI